MTDTGRSEQYRHSLGLRHIIRWEISIASPVGLDSMTEFKSLAVRICFFQPPDAYQLEAGGIGHLCALVLGSDPDTWVFLLPCGSGRFEIVAIDPCNTYPGSRISGFSGKLWRIPACRSEMASPQNDHRTDPRIYLKRPPTAPKLVLPPHLWSGRCPWTYWIANTGPRGRAPQ
jgi:hypothetical protein